ncbi:hypothetical protein FTX61_13845 [Nitriliruptoraceae bacterium ZYF776]|nr:hypothetical protein [Profundirhabdus halotolerans]
MYVSAEDARSDVILAGAAAIFGPLLLTLVDGTPGLPRAGAPRVALDLAFAFAITGLVPLLLARYRRDLPGAFLLGPVRGAQRPRAQVTTGLVLALPIAVLGIVRGLAVVGELGPAALGRISAAALPAPVVGRTTFDVVGALLAVATVVVLTLGALLLIGFVTVRGRDAFRQDDRSSTELLRTVGMGAAGLGLVLGLVRSIGSGSPLLAVLNALTLAAVVLLVDRQVPRGATVPRAAVLTPAVLVVLLHVFAAGGLLGGGLVRGLQTGALAGGIALALAILAEHRRSMLVAVPALVALAWWPSCLSPVPILAGLSAC